MRIKITSEPADGQFTVGGVYNVISCHNGFVYAEDDVCEMEAVYFYEFVWEER